MRELCRSWFSVKLFTVCWYSSKRFSSSSVFLSCSLLLGLPFSLFFASLLRCSFGAPPPLVSENFLKACLKSVSLLLLNNSLVSPFPFPSASTSTTTSSFFSSSSSPSGFALPTVEANHCKKAFVQLLTAPH